MTPEEQRLVQGRHHDPFSVLGRHTERQRDIVRVFIPGAVEVRVVECPVILRPLSEESGLFFWQGTVGTVPDRYRLEWVFADGRRHTAYDPYCFPPQIPDFDLHLFTEGRHWHVYRMLGARCHRADGIPGVLFSAWAPNAARVSVVGDFNGWDGRLHPMRVRGASGVWELFIPGIAVGVLYKFEIRHRESGTILVKSDPYGRQFEMRPGTAAVVESGETYPWTDQSWMERRHNYDWLHTPMSVYEVHLGSWRLDPQGHFLGYAELAARLVEYVTQAGYTHIQLLPITEHPFDGSWGYQTTGYYAPTRRHGAADEFRCFVDYCHRHGIGILLDWVPGHFPRDSQALARYDGTPLYEHEDPRRGEHPDWGTLIFNYGRNEVKNFLIASALFWLEEYHIDGLRVDAVASMLYLDYSRAEGQWVPNVYGGRENIEAIAFLRELNHEVLSRHPGVLMIAEESTAWPLVTRPPSVGGLGFSIKWNLGWMHDTLSYIAHDPIYRRHHHEQLTFGLLYVFNENFLLPLSHDEVVHGKGSMLEKMPGDLWQRFANLRLLYTYLYTYPGKKLLFMGNEFGETREWSHERSLDWTLLDNPQHAGVGALVRDLNQLYRQYSALYRYDFEPQGFEWLDCDDKAASVLTYLRRDGGQIVVVALNFTPVPRPGYHVGVPLAGTYREILNSDSVHYGGSNMGNGGPVWSEQVAWRGQPHRLRVTLPPLAGIVFEWTGD